MGIVIKYPNPIMQYFEYTHLPENLQKVSKPFHELATVLEASLPDGPEKTAGLRKLLEAKDCMVKGSLLQALIKDFKEKTMTIKTLHNTDVNGARKNIPDITVFGDGDMFKLLSKASSEKEGWMKSTKAMAILGVGCVVQVTTQQRNPDGSYSLAEAVTFVPGVTIVEDSQGRHLVKVM